MSAAALVERVRTWPAPVWVGVAGLALFWMTRPRPSSPRDGGRVLGSEDIQVMSPAGAYNPLGAHAVGLPYDYAHLCPVDWQGRIRPYPTQSSGVLAAMAVPDPGDDDGYPWLSYGPMRGPI